MDNNSTSYFHQLYNELDEKLKEIEKADQDILVKSRTCYDLCQTYIEILRTKIREQGFPDKLSEIRFFKQTKPRFLSRYLHYVRRFYFHRDMPIDTFENINNYIKEEYKRIAEFFKNNREFLIYIKLGQDYSDQKYFVRSEMDITIMSFSHVGYEDPLFCTSHDYLVAEILSNKRMVEHLQEYTGRLKSSESLSFDQAEEKASDLTWTESAAAATQLIYALQGSSAINNGNASLKEIANTFKEAFNWDTGNIYDHFQHMKLKKKDPARFLQQLVNIFLKRLNEGL
jgi:hypothetical protein